MPWPKRYFTSPPEPTHHSSSLKALELLWGQPSLEDAIDLGRRGYSLSYISRITGFTKKTIGLHLRAAGIDYPRKHRKDPK
jgi:hypothetical protein